MHGNGKTRVFDDAIEVEISPCARCFAALLHPIKLSIDIVEHFPLMTVATERPCLQQKSDKLLTVLDFVGHRQRFLDLARRDIASNQFQAELFDGSATAGMAGDGERHGREPWIRLGRRRERERPPPTLP